MKICIVTVYNSENCGSFLQAYALKTILEQKGNQVSFLFRSAKGTSHDFKAFLITCIKYFIQGKIKKLIVRMSAYRRFKRATRGFKVVKLNSYEYEKQKMIVIGSDTLWNFDDAYFYSKKDIYSGFLFQNKNAITYALSVANTKEETIKGDNIICTGISKLKSITVRDEYTADIVTGIIGERPLIVLDPTLLLSSSDYESIEGRCKYNNFLLIYTSMDLVKEQKKNEILDIKRKEGVGIIAFGNYVEWADVNVSADPFSFLAYIKKAKYIVTDTYHGTLFSIIYKKSFVCLNQKKNKVRDILTTIGLTGRFATDEMNISDALKKQIDYEKVYVILNNKRRQSLLFLENNIMEE